MLIIVRDTARVACRASFKCSELRAANSWPRSEKRAPWTHFLVATDGSRCRDDTPSAEPQAFAIPHQARTTSNRVGVYRALTDILNARGSNRGAICGMRKLQVHTSSYETTLEHGPSPSGTGDCDQNRFRAVFGMPRNQHGVLGHTHSRVIVMLRLNPQHSSRRKICEEDSPFNL